MRIIRDDDDSSFEMLAVLIDWGIRRCNVKGCTTVPNTIIVSAPGAQATIGLCEEHFQKANQPTGPVTYSFVWDTFDAFAYQDTHKDPKEE
ncbi:hypothetical protein LCGC14_0276110 [marine sediment metagenome]|uniref:Uncharacterized protein n=1 Tax=marine sediment metagenome TaxID=412755 RepID=A0A0F9U2P0_9ZZZZ